MSGVKLIKIKIINLYIFYNLVCSEDKEETIKSKTPTPEVDEEGYCVRPKVESWDIDKGSSFYSSSDTDSGRSTLCLLKAMPRMKNLSCAILYQPKKLRFRLPLLMYVKLNFMCLFQQMRNAKRRYEWRSNL